MSLAGYCCQNGTFDKPHVCAKQPGFQIKDSGQRRVFESGMVRETTEDKIDYARVMEGPMFDRWAVHLTKGAIKYPDIAPGVANWTLADGKGELHRFREAAARHFRQWMRGDTDEDHASATFFNINGYEFVKEKLKKEVKSTCCGDCMPDEPCICDQDCLK